jgi:hypothetical protein
MGLRSRELNARVFSRLGLPNPAVNTLTTFRNYGERLDLFLDNKEPSMTYSNDPNRTNRDRHQGNESKTGMWVAAALAAIVVIGGIVYATSDRDTQNASTPGATTGAGTTTPSNSPPAGTPPAPTR